MPPAVRILVPASIIQQMLCQARAELPNECCGLLAGRRVPTADGEAPAGSTRFLVEKCYPLVNFLASPTEFESEPASMFAAIRDMRRQGTEVLAVYHSHPASPPVPSRKDIARNWSPEVMNLIISLQGPGPVIQGWWIDETGFTEAEWESIDG